MGGSDWVSDRGRVVVIAVWNVSGSVELEGGEEHGVPLMEKR